MWLAKTGIFFFLIYLSGCDNSSPDDTSGAIFEAAKTLFSDQETLQNVGKQVGEMFSDKNSGVESVDNILSGIGNFMTGGKNRHGIDMSMLGSMLETLMPSEKSRSKRRARGDEDIDPPAGFDLETLATLGNMVSGKSGNSDALLGLLPVLLDTFFGGSGGGGSEEGGGTNIKKQDHSGHSWYMPPILEHIHVMWEHFSNSELGQTLWKNSGLANIVGQMTDKDGNIQYTQILDSFENPMLRRRWIKSLTNFVAEWVSRISDPVIQQRYLATAQFVTNSFLKAQGLPKAAMFDSSKPAESITRLCNIVAAKHLGMKIDCSQYVKPAVAYLQELMNLASDKGFIMSRINAMELSNKLSDTINNDLIGPILKAYRAYKWSVKVPSCATQILCTINERRKDEPDNSVPEIRRVLTKISSFPAAYFISANSSLNFWNLYGAIVENGDCMIKYPEDCTAFHEEELRVTTTEYVHSEL